MTQQLQLSFDTQIHTPTYRQAQANQARLHNGMSLLDAQLAVFTSKLAASQQQYQHLTQQLHQVSSEQEVRWDALAIAIETTQVRQDTLEQTLADQQATFSAEMADLHATLQTELQQLRSVQPPAHRPQPLAPLKQQLRLHAQRLTRVELEQQQITQLTAHIEALSQRLATLEQARPVATPTAPASALWHSTPGQAKRPQRPRRDRVAVFIDGSNINCSAHHAQISLDYPALISGLVGGNPLSGRYYFGGMVTGDQAVLRRHQGLQSQGFTVYARQERDGKANQDIALALEMLRLAPQFDTALLLSGDGDFIPVVQQLQGLGKRVEVASFDSQTHHRLRRLADSYIELGSLVAAVA